MISNGDETKKQKYLQIRRNAYTILHKTINGNFKQINKDLRFEKMNLIETQFQTFFVQYYRQTLLIYFIHKITLLK